MNHKTSIRKRRIVLTLTLFFCGTAALSVAGPVLAQANQTIGTVATNIVGTLARVAQLITGVGFVAGFGFAIAAIFKFKQHKDNPTQIPIGTPIALLFIGAALMFLPSLFSTIGKTIFGTQMKPGTPTGQQYITGKQS